mmetsp:Transcript_20043/g.50554  ORF Transcript_20043/g.50554 Transcript_20043/m.50554 type:complete len:201 (-) Transcript_20043:2406-3008(-)
MDSERDAQVGDQVRDEEDHRVRKVLELHRFGGRRLVRAREAGHQREVTSQHADQRDPDHDRGRKKPDQHAALEPVKHLLLHELHQRTDPFDVFRFHGIRWRNAGSFLWEGFEFRDVFRDNAVVRELEGTVVGGGALVTPARLQFRHFTVQPPLSLLLFLLAVGRASTSFLFLRRGPFLGFGFFFLLLTKLLLGHLLRLRR